MDSEISCPPVRLGKNCEMELRPLLVASMPGKETSDPRTTSPAGALAGFCTDSVTTAKPLNVMKHLVRKQDTHLWRGNFATQQTIVAMVNLDEAVLE